MRIATTWVFLLLLVTGGLMAVQPLPARAQTPTLYEVEDYHSDNGNLWRRYTYYYHPTIPGFRVLHGRYLTFNYWHSGAISSDQYFQHGVLHGKTTQYLPCGKVSWETTYRNGKQHGTTRQISYYDEEGACAPIRFERIQNHVDGVLNGVYEETYYGEDGSKTSHYVGPYHDGMLEGVVSATFWHPDGSIASQTVTTYVEGFPLDGTYQSNYTYLGGPQQPTNIPGYEAGPTLYGLRHGTWVTHWLTGSLDMQVESIDLTDYRFGVKDGSEIHERVYMSPSTVGVYAGYRNQMNANGRAHGAAYGDYMTRDFARTREFEGAYAYGKRHGNWTNYYTSGDYKGRVSSAGQISNGKLCGTWLTSTVEWNFETRSYELIYSNVDHGPAEALEVPGLLDAGELSGTVVDRRLGFPLANVQVTAEGNSTTTDATGGFTVQAPEGETVQVSLSRDGAVSRSVTVPVPRGSAASLGTLPMVRTNPKPLLLDVRHSYPSPSIFLEGVSIPAETYTAVVDWNNVDDRVGSVEFKVGSSTLAVPAPGDDPTEVPATFEMGQAPFVPSFNPLTNRVRVRAVLDGLASDPAYIDLMVVPVPLWAQWLGGFTNDAYDSSYGLVSYKLKASYPKDPFAIQINPQALGPTMWQAWSLMPMIGGKNFGIPPSKAELESEVKSDGSGSVTLSGVTGFEAAGKSIEGKLGGTGNVAYSRVKGFEWKGAALNLGVKGTIEQSAGLVTVIPALSGATSIPYVGGLIGRFNNLAKVQGSVYAETQNSLEIISKDAALSFSAASGNVRTGLNLGLAAPVHEKFKATLLGGGETVLYWEIPANPSYLKDAESKIYANLVFNIWSFEKTFAAESGFRLSDSSGKAFVSGGPPLDVSAPMRPLVFAAAPGRKYHVVAVERVLPTVAKVLAGEPVRSVVVTNTYRHPEPVLLGADGAELLAVVVYAVGLDAVQATEIQVIDLAAADPGASAVALTDDTQADFAPALALDAQGQAVAVWERVRDAAFTSEDVADMAAQMEIAFAWRDGTTGTWSTPAFATNNTQLDYSPRLLTAPDGTVAATWLSSASSELLATTTEPVSLHLAPWNPAAHTFAPVAAPLVLGNLLTHATAWDGTEAVAVATLDADGDPMTTGDAQVARFRYNGSWGAAEMLTPTPGSHELPWTGQSAAGNDVLWASDGGILHVRNNDAPTSAGPAGGIAQPRTYAAAVRPADGALALVWQEPMETGTGLIASVLDPDAAVWSEPIMLDAGALDTGTPAVSFTPRGTLSLVFPSHTADEITFEITATDLVRIEQDVARDLAPDGATLRFDPPLPVPGEAVTVYVDLVNHGELAVTAPVLDFQLGTEQAPGASVGRVTVPGVLPGRGRVAVSLDMVAPAVGEDAHYLHVTADPDAAVDERDETNNTAVRAMLLPDLEVVSTRVEHLDVSALVRLWAEVRNNGFVDVADAQVQVLLEGEDNGRVPASLPAGETCEVYVELGRANLTDTGRLVEFVINPDELIDEATRENNRLGVSLAPFAEDDGEIVVLADPAEGGTVSGSGRFPVWSIQRLIARPAQGWAFAAWNDGVADDVRDVVVEDDPTTWTATFVRQKGTLTVTAEPANGGTVAGEGTYDAWSDAVITATPAPGWRLASWGDDAGLLDGNREQTRTVRVLGDETWTAHFEAASSLSVTILPAEAAAAGGAWRRTWDTTWHAGGEAETDAPVGDVTVEFLPIDGWMTPGRLTATLDAGGAVVLEATYIPVLASEGSVWMAY
ncbi:MAG: hypothetical protein PWP23_1115 [Candidatus Sumerlaeota bacterium]|nr:hypothetical protein [Candidatus Sumerlaeota bacterium]